jgi:hypothetical protein
MAIDHSFRSEGGRSRVAERGKKGLSNLEFFILMIG